MHRPRQPTCRRLGLWLALVASLLHALAPAWAQGAGGQRVVWAEVCSLEGVQRIALHDEDGARHDHLRCLVCLAGVDSAPLPSPAPAHWAQPGPAPVPAVASASRATRQPWIAASPRGPPRHA